MPRWLIQIRLRLNSLLGRKQLDRDLQDELAFHLSMREEKIRAAGIDADEAHHAAHRQFGNVTHIKERSREMWTFAFLEGISRDLRVGLRMLLKNPAFTIVAIFTLALGIGANTAIFSVINSVLLRPLPFEDPDRLVRVFSARDTPANLPVSGEDYFDWEAQNRTFQSTSLFSSMQKFNASGDGKPETVSVVGTQANFFSVLGIAPLRGRAFASGEDNVGTNHVALLSYAFWRGHFGAAPDVLGKNIKLNFQVFTVIGVMPATFNYPEATDVWIPLEMSVDRLGRRGNYSYQVLARLKPGVTFAQAQADMSSVASHLADLYPLMNTGLSVRLMSLKQRVTGSSRPQLLILLGAVGLVLLVACTNVANLLLSRATGRQRELALRATLGATRWRLLRQLLTESLVLSLGGAALGLAGAWFLVKLVNTSPSLPIPRQNPVQLDGTVLLYTAAIAIVVGVLFGLAPALQGSRLDVSDELKSSAVSVAGTSGWRLLLRNALVVAQIATSLALLAGAGLLLRSFAEMRNANIGVRTENILTSAVVLPETKYAKFSERREFCERLLDRVQHIPGVTGAAIAQQIPLEGSHGGAAKLPGDTDLRHNGTSINLNYVTPGYFQTLGISFLSGSDFSLEQVNRSAEVGSKVFDYWESGGKPLESPQPQWSTYAIINRSMAEALWPGQDAVGRVFISSLIQPVTVIGVVADEKYDSIRDTPAPEMYFPFTEALNNKWYPPNLIVRSSQSPEAILSGVRTSLHDLDSELSLFRVRTMQQVIADDMQDTTLQTLLLGSFAALGLILSAVGIYGVMAFLVKQRTHEIGIRVALGAQRSQILGLVIAHGLKLTVIGVALGLFLALTLTRLLSTELFGVSARDPFTFLAVSLFLAAVALAACYLPARRATSVDPLVALHYE
jgi:putative ABC transport system permease protein